MGSCDAIIQLTCQRVAVLHLNSDWLLGMRCFSFAGSYFIIELFICFLFVFVFARFLSHNTRAVHLVLSEGVCLVVSPLVSQPLYRTHTLILDGIVHQTEEILTTKHSFV